MATVSTRPPIIGRHSFRTVRLAAVMFTLLSGGSTGMLPVARGQALTEQTSDAPSPAEAASSNPAPAVVPDGNSADYSRLSEPAVADSLKLSSEQRTKIQEILAAREAALAAADETGRSAIRQDSDRQMAAVLTDDQQRLLSTLFAEKVLRFNFRYQKWADVLDWVSREADLSLVMDTPPPGTFHYSDSKDYSPTEAIDLLNGWLLTKGFTLVRRDRMLMCLDLKNGLPEGAIPSVTPEELSTRGRFDFVSVLIPLEGRAPEAVLAEVKPLLGTYGKAEPLAQTQQLLVFDTAARLRTIQQVVKKIPLPSSPAPPVAPPRPQLVVYPMEHANPLQAGEVLKQIVTGTVVVDDKARQISVNAVPDEQQKAKTIIDQLESNQGPASLPQLQLYPVIAADSDQLLATLKLVAPQSQFRIDQAAQRLVAWATETEHQTIADALQKLVTEPTAGGPRQLQVYSLGSVEPSAASAMLSSLLPTARMTVDTKSRSLIAVATLADHQAIRALVDQMEAEAAAGRSSAQLKSYPIESAQSSTAVTLLSRVFPDAQVTIDAAGERLLILAAEQDHQLIGTMLQQIREQTTENGRELKSWPLKPRVNTSSVTALLASLVPGASVTADEANRRLLISATAEEHQQIGQIIEQVESSGGGEQPELRFYPLKKDSGTSLVTILQAMVPSAQLTHQAAEKRLSAVATVSEHEVLAKTIEQFESATPTPEPRTLRIFDVTTAQRTRFQAIAAQLASELPGMQVITDSQPDELAVWATPAQLEILGEILTQLHREVPAEHQARLIVYPVEKVDPASVSTILSSLFPDAKITVDAKLSRLTVHAKPAVHDAIRAAIEQLDTDIPVEKEIRLMVYPVGGINSSTAQNLIVQEVPNVTVIADTTAETLIVRGRIEDQQRVAELLDALKNSASALQERRAVSYGAVFSDPIRTTEFFASAFPRTKVVMDPARRRMTVWATDAEHQLIRDAVAGMEDSGDEKSLQVFEANQINPATLLSLLSSSVPDASFIRPTGSQAVMAWLDPRQTQNAQQVMERLKASQETTGSSTLEFYSIRDLGPGATSILSQAVPAASISAGARSDQIAVTATPPDHEKVRQVLARLDREKLLPPERLLTVHNISGTSPASVQQVLQPLMDADVQITVDPTGRKLFVRATQEKQDRIRQIVEQIAASLQDGGGRTTKTYVVGVPNADEAQEVLTALYPDAKIVTDADRKILVATALPEQHVAIEQITSELRNARVDGEPSVPRIYSLERADVSEVLTLLQSTFSRIDGVRLSVNAQTGRLVAVAREEQQAAIAELIRQLDEAPAAGERRELATFRLRQMDGRAVQEALQPLLPKSAQVTVDRFGGQLFVSAPAGEMPEIRTMVQQMLVPTSGNDKLTTHIYRLLPSEADEAQEALQALFPDATLVTDSGREVLVATATQEQHETIREIVAEMSNAEGTADGAPRAQAYPLTFADGQSTAIALQGLFGRRDDVRVSFDAKANSLLVVGRPHQHETVARLLEQMEQVDPTAGPRRLEIYPLRSMDSTTAVQTATGVLKSVDPSATVSYERQSRHLIVTTTEAGHEKLRTAVDSLVRRDEREVDVIQLRFLGATSAQVTLENLFLDSDLNSEEQPLIQADDDSQQLLIRATPAQLQQIRTLLRKMGESGLAANGEDSSSGHLRVIPVSGDVEPTLRRIQDLWPRIRRNSVRVISVPVSGDGQPDQKPRTSPAQFSVPAETPSAVVVQETTDLETATAPQAKPTTAELPVSQVKDSPSASQAVIEPSAKSQDLPEIVIVPGPDRITISSDDLEALDQMESLLRAAFSRPMSGGMRNRDFSVYQLRNAGADEVARTLRSVYESRGGLLAFDSVVLVPESRMNALIVYGSRIDRERIEHLLEYLDSEKLPDTARAFRTEVIPVVYSSAAQVDQVLRGVYRAEMTAGGSRQSIEIPSGIPASVASVLRQINAAASSPLLTVEVQRDTNSLIVKAPQSLLEEVRVLISDLDEASSKNRSRTVQLLPLQKTNSTRVMRMLGNILD